jgi:DeoR-like helix-turn-helix domain
LPELGTTGASRSDKTSCPKCGKSGAGPYLKRVGKGNHYGFYYKHIVIENGARRTVWHYVPKREPYWRREKLVRLVKERGWCGMRYFASLLNVSEHTIRRDLDALKAEGRIIHQPYGGFLADPSGTLLKEKPWIAWT